MLTINSYSDGAAEIEHVLKKRGRFTPTALANAKKLFRKFLASEPTIQKAAEATIERVERDCAAVAKSEVDSSDVYSQDFYIGPSTAGQRAAETVRALQIQGLAQAATRRLQAMGVENPTEDDVSRAIAAVLNVSITSYEGEDGQTRVDSNPAVAARLRERERAGGTVWELTDLADPRQRADADEAMVTSNFAGLRNLGYTSGRSATPDGTNFSGGTGNSVPPAPAGTTAAPTASDASIAAIAEAAYRAGVAAASNFAKRKGR